MKLVAAPIRLMLEGLPREVLWRVVGHAGVDGILVWSRTAVHGVLHAVPTSIASGKLWPKDVPEGGILVTPTLGPVRSGMAVHFGPKGFRLETLIVVNEDHTWSPAPVWVGDRLELVETTCPSCGGDLGGTAIGRLESHVPGCPRFPL